MLAIKSTKTKEYIAGFSAEHQIVQWTTDPAYVKHFKTKAAVTKFINKYADCGYGFSSKHIMIVFLFR